MFRIGERVIVDGEWNGKVFNQEIGTVVSYQRADRLYEIEFDSDIGGWGLFKNRWYISKEGVSDRINIEIDEDEIRYEFPKPMIETYTVDDSPYNIALYGIKKLIIAEPHVIGIDGDGNEFISTCCGEDKFDAETGVKIMCFKKERYDSQRRINLIRREIRKLEREIKSEEKNIRNVDNLLNRY